MPTLAQYITTLERFDPLDLFDAVLKIDSVEEGILDINRSQMKDDGELATGKKISPNYTPNYQKYYKKGSKTKPTPDLYQTGDRNEALQFVKHTRGEVTIDSPVPYSVHLEERYTIEINGIQQSRMPKVVGLFLPEYQKEFRKHFS